MADAKNGVTLGRFSPVGRALSPFMFLRATKKQKGGNQCLRISNESRFELQKRYTMR